MTSEALNRGRGKTTVSEQHLYSLNKQHTCQYRRCSDMVVLPRPTCISFVVSLTRQAAAFKRRCNLSVVALLHYCTTLLTV